MADMLVAAPGQAVDEFGAVFEDGRIDIVRSGQSELVEQVEIIPEADPVAVIAPRVIALALRCRRARRVAAEPGPKGEILDVVVEGDGAPCAAGPFGLPALMDRDGAIAAVSGKLHWRAPWSGMPTPPS